MTARSSKSTEHSIPSMTFCSFSPQCQQVPLTLQYGSTLDSLKVFGRWLLGLGGQLVKKDTRVRPKWDEMRGRDRELWKCRSNEPWKCRSG